MADIETGHVLARYLADDASHPVRRIWGHIHRLHKAIYLYTFAQKGRREVRFYANTTYLRVRLLR